MADEKPEPEVKVSEVPLIDIVEEVKEQKEYLNSKKVKDKGIVTVKLLRVVRAYEIQREGQAPWKKIELEVEVINAKDNEEKGKKYYFSIGKKNIKKLIQVFGDRPEGWINKPLYVTVMGDKPYEYVAIVNDIVASISPIEEMSA